MLEDVQVATVGHPEYITSSGQRWVDRHAEFRDGVWVCKETGATIQCKSIGRSIWTYPEACAGSGEVRPIAHVWCPECGTEPDVAYGTPVNESDLVKIL